MQDNRKKTDSVKQIKEQRKLAPYSVTPIGGASELKAWKAEQARKQQEWDAGKAARYAVHKERAVSIMNYELKPSIDSNAKTVERYKANHGEKAYPLSAKTSAENDTKPVVPEKIPVLTRLINKFLDIKLT